MLPKALKRNVKISITPTVEEIAELFCDLDADEQAVFFNTVGQLSDKWQDSFVEQVIAIVNSEKLTPAGKRIMDLIGDQL